MDCSDFWNPAGDLLYYQKNAPPGYRFEPTDVQLLGYLHSKEQGRPHANMIKEVLLYDYNPNELQSNFNDGRGNELYLYTKTKPLKNGTRVERRAGKKGRWKTMIGEKEIVEGSKTIGFKTTLSFYRFVDEKRKETKTCWNMHEYRLPHGNGKRKVKDYFTLCKIYKRHISVKTDEALNEENTSISSKANSEIDTYIGSCSSLQSPSIVSDVASAECGEHSYQLSIPIEDVNVYEQGSLGANTIFNNQVVENNCELPSSSYSQVSDGLEQHLSHIVSTECGKNHSLQLPLLSSIEDVNINEDELLWANMISSNQFVENDCYKFPWSSFDEDVLVPMNIWDFSTDDSIWDGVHM